MLLFPCCCIVLFVKSISTYTHTHSRKNNISENFTKMLTSARQTERGSIRGQGDPWENFCGNTHNWTSYPTKGSRVLQVARKHGKNQETFSIFIYKHIKIFWSKKRLRQAFTCFSTFCFFEKHFFFKCLHTHTHSYRVAYVAASLVVTRLFF